MFISGWNSLPQEPFLVGLRHLVEADAEEVVEGVGEVGFDVVGEEFGAEGAIVAHEWGDSSVAILEFMDEGGEGVDGFALVGRGNLGVVVGGGLEGVLGLDEFLHLLGVGVVVAEVFDEDGAAGGMVVVGDGDGAEEGGGALLVGDFA